MAQTATASQKVITVISQTLVISGVLLTLLSTALAFQRYSPYRLNFDVSFDQKVAAKKTLTSISLPTRIIIPETTIDLPIIGSTIKDQKWETTSKGVSYLSISPTPGEKGNSIMYGHNWTNLLGPLVNVKPGNEIRIEYADGSVRKFIVQATALVTPDDTSILLPSDEALLTIYTCAGFFDSKRFVVTARKV